MSGVRQLNTSITKKAAASTAAVPHWAGVLFLSCKRRKRSPSRMKIVPLVYHTWSRDAPLSYSGAPKRQKQELPAQNPLTGFGVAALLGLQRLFALVALAEVGDGHRGLAVGLVGHFDLGQAALVALGVVHTLEDITLNAGILN